MKKSLLKILITLIVLLMFPATIVTVYQFSQLSKNEKLLWKAYENQLESISISVNSYIHDIANNWASRVELSLQHENIGESKILSRLVNETPAIKSILIQGKQQNQILYTTQETRLTNELLDTITSRESKAIKQISAYAQSNYRKLVSAETDSVFVMFFVVEGPDSENAICFIEMDVEQFLKDQLSSRIQSIAQGSFVISLLDVEKNRVVVSTAEGANFKHVDLERDLWFIPNIKIQIILMDKNITQLARERTREIIIMLAIMGIILVFGGWFLFSSIKRELHLAQIKSEFISNVSHEIRTPLALISMYIETLQMGRVKSQEKVDEYYSIIFKETSRLTGIVNKILNFSKIESGKRQFKMATCNLTEITENVLETYDFHFRSKGFEHAAELAPDIPDIMCDCEAIADAIVNLIDNAIKYSDGKKRVEISTGIEKNFTYVEVKDFGVGISKKDQKLVFDKFYRVTSGNLAHKAKGTGLGLSIVGETLKAHKGHIKLISKLDEGSTFRLYFPKAEK